MQDIPVRPPIPVFALLVALLFLCRAGAAQFVDLTVEIELNNWSYWFFEDEKELLAQRGQATASVFTKSSPIRCVVSANTWMMESDVIVRNSRVTRWFTGSNIIEHTLITQALSEDEIKRRSQISGLAMTSPRVGDQHTRVYETADGNPGRPVRVANLFMDTQGIIAWLAYCSGPALKCEGRRIPLPSALWKEYFSGDFSDTTTPFDDSLGLPKSIEIYTKQGQLVFQYQVRQSTNVLGWNFPSEFYLVQYCRARWPRTNSFELHLTGKGKVTAMSVANSVMPAPPRP